MPSERSANLGWLREGGPLTLKFLCGHSLYISGLLFFFSLLRTLVEAKISHDHLQAFTGDDTKHVPNLVGQHPHQVPR